MRYVVAFICINLALYVFIAFFHAAVPINKLDYSVAYHFITDPRIENKPYDFLKSFAVFDAQWYLRIASNGYPKTNGSLPLEKIDIDNAPTYAFFPLYPLFIYMVNLVIHNIFLSSMIVANVILVIDFLVLYFLLKRITNGYTAIKTCFLLFFFPTAIFLRSYFSEGLFLFFLLLYSYFLLQNRYIRSSIVLGFLMIIKGTAFPLLPLLVYFYLRSKKTAPTGTKLVEIIKISLISLVPLLVWILFCYGMTGNPLVSIKVRTLWLLHRNPIIPFIQNSPFSYILSNLYNIIEFPFLSWHSFNSSKLDVLTTGIVLFILLKSRKVLPAKLWYISFLLWIVPLFTVQYMSFTRLQIVSFPLFYYLAKKLKNWSYFACLFLFTAGLFILSIYFVNWFWVG